MKQKLAAYRWINEDQLWPIRMRKTKTKIFILSNDRNIICNLVILFNLKSRKILTSIYNAWNAFYQCFPIRVLRKTNKWCLNFNNKVYRKIRILFWSLRRYTNSQNDIVTDSFRLLVSPPLFSDFWIQLDHSDY